jgi:hypothetical protein
MALRNTALLPSPLDSLLSGGGDNFLEQLSQGVSLKLPNKQIDLRIRGLKLKTKDVNIQLLPSDDSSNDSSDDSSNDSSDDSSNDSSDDSSNDSSDDSSNDSSDDSSDDSSNDSSNSLLDILSNGVYQLQGQAFIQLYTTSATIDLGPPDQFLRVSKSKGVELNASFSIQNVPIVPRVFELQNATLKINTPANEVGLSAQFLLPKGILVGGAANFSEGRIDSIAAFGNNLNVVIPTTPLFLQDINGKLENLAPSNPKPFNFSSGLRVTGGTQVSINLPSWAGGRKSGALCSFGGQVDINAERFNGRGQFDLLGGVNFSTINS